MNKQRVALKKNMNMLNCPETKDRPTIYPSSYKIEDFIEIRHSFYLDCILPCTMISLNIAVFLYNQEISCYKI
jgi:hypothetical protein